MRFRRRPLYDRLAAENRLDLDDETAYGTNVIPLRMSREELTDGLHRVDARGLLHRRRISIGSMTCFSNDGFRFAMAAIEAGAGIRGSGLKSQATNLVRFAGIYWRLMRMVHRQIAAV